MVLEYPFREQKNGYFLTTAPLSLLFETYSFIIRIIGSIVYWPYEMSMLSPCIRINNCHEISKLQ